MRRPCVVEQARLRPRDAIPGQPADRLEQRRPERVVQMARRQLTRLQAQVVLDVVGKRPRASGVVQTRRDGLRHQTLLAHRNAA